MHQLEPDIRHTVLGNAGTIISFRVGPEDASILAKEFRPKFDVPDLLNLPNHDLYLKLMIDGVPSQPFSAAARSDAMVKNALAEMSSQRASNKSPELASDYQ